MASFQRIAQFPALAREEFGACEWNNRIWISGGLNAAGAYLNDVWYSDDGMNWEQAATGATSFGAREGHTMLVHDGALWVIGGYNGSVYFNDVWRSGDGVNWEQVGYAPASFTARDDGCVYSLKGRLYVVGGDGAVNFDDVWCSYDGRIWRQVINNYALVRRTHVRPVVFDNRMWLIGGYDADAATTSNQTLYSDDGWNWEINGTANGLPRIRDYAATVFDGKIVVSGGTQGEGERAAAESSALWYSYNGVNWKLGMQNMQLVGNATIADHEMVSLKSPNRLFLFMGNPTPGAVSGDIYMATQLEEHDD